MTDVVVAGGGLAGLVAARHLAETGCDVTLFETRDTVGGRVASHDRDGFVIDHGFQVLLTGYPAAQRELTYETLKLRRFTPGAVICKSGKRSVLSDPRRDLGAVTNTLFSRAITIGDKIRAWRLQRELAGPESVEATFDTDGMSIREELVARGFSERFIDNFAAPFYGGITLDRSLSTAWPVFAYTFGLLADGYAAIPAAGMRAIPAQLRERALGAGVTIETGSQVTAIDLIGKPNAGSSVPSTTETPAGDTLESSPPARDPSTERKTASGVNGPPPSNPNEESSPNGAGTNEDAARSLDGDQRVRISVAGDTVDANAAVVATDPATARQLTDVESIPTASRGCLTQFYALPGGEELGVGGRILLNAADDRPNVVVPHSEVAPGHAPVGEALISATFLGTPAEPDRELMGATTDALTAWFPERSFADLSLIETIRVPFAQFEQPPGFFERRPSPTAPDGPVVLAGEYTRWSSIQGALESGRRAAWALLK